MSWRRADRTHERTGVGDPGRIWRPRKTPCAGAASGEDGNCLVLPHPRPMNLADVFTVVLVILGFLTVFVCIWLMSAGLCPALVERCAGRLGAAPFRCALVGVVGVVPLFAIAAAVGRVAPNAPGKILSVLIYFFTVLAALFGTAGLAWRIGHGLPAARDQQEPWRRVLRGGIVLAITFLTIVMIPLTLIPGLGAFLLARFGRNAVPEPAAPANL